MPPLTPRIIVFAIFYYFHLIAAIVGIGGTIMLKYVIVPTISAEEEPVRSRFHARARGRLAWLVLFALGVLVLSGISNLIRALTVPPHPPSAYHMIFGIKILLVIPLFVIALLLVAPGSSPNMFQRNRARWLAFNSHLGLTIVALSVALRVISGK